MILASYTVYSEKKIASYTVYIYIFVSIEHAFLFLVTEHVPTPLYNTLALIFVQDHLFLEGKKENKRILIWGLVQKKEPI